MTIRLRNDGLFSGGEIRYTINGPFDRYQRFSEKLRSRLIREYKIDTDNENSGAPKEARIRYKRIRDAAFARYLSEIA